MIRSRPLFLFVVLLAMSCGPASEDLPPVQSESSVEVPDIRFRNLTSDATFVGDTACFSCHEDQYTGFQEHGMARSLYKLTSETAVESFGSDVVRDGQTGFQYRMFEERGKYYMEEFLLDEGGKQTHRLVREMEYVVGSGTIARTYLAEENGWFYEMPVTWYTQAQRWDMSPGYEKGNQRFDRKIVDRCIVCHNSYPEPEPFTNGKYRSMPSGIGCERCHGPGSLHVDERLAVPEATDGIDDTIVNPAHLTLERRLDVCQQCHLNATVSLLREGRSAYDFRPSQNLADYLSLYVNEDGGSSDEISVISHADRMRRSACYLATAASGTPMECTTCHDPHGGFREQGDTYFNATCMTCHEPNVLSGQMPTADLRKDHTASSNCLSCHMPRKDLVEAPHSAFTDHWIRVVDTDSNRVSTGTPATEHLAPYFERDRFEEGLPYEGMAYITYGRQEGDQDALRKGIALLDEVFAGGREPSEAVYLHGYAYTLLGEYENAMPSLEKAVVLDPDKPERLNALAQAYEATNRSPVSTERLYLRALSSQPELANIRINYGRFLETQNRRGEAIEAYETAIQSEPWNGIAYYNLGTAFVRDGKFEEAKEALESSLELDPLNPGAWSNLGFLYIQEENQEQALASFVAGVTANPEHPDALSNLGTFYLNTNDLRRAVELLERSAEAYPQSADVFAKLALAHFRLEKYDTARTFADRALQLDPGNSMALQIIGAL